VKVELHHHGHPRNAAEIEWLQANGIVVAHVRVGFADITDGQIGLVEFDLDPDGRRIVNSAGYVERRTAYPLTVRPEQFGLDASDG
jgi:hypothetical protein